MLVKRYNSEYAPLWDAFVKTSRNGLFMFERAYMDYHKHRFNDHSLMFYDNRGSLLALLPANETAKVLSSHSGLTFGGFILSAKVKSSVIKDLFEQTKSYLQSLGFKQWIYKPVPYIYHQAPSQEEEYFLWLNHAKETVCNLSTTIDLRLPYTVKHSKLRVRCLKKARETGIDIVESRDLSHFWPIVEESLSSRYKTLPVHTKEEMDRLMESFPSNIRCFLAQHGDVVCGGIIVYESKVVAHIQYSHSTSEGKKLGVMDLLFSYLINYYKEQRPEIRYFDFGISNEKDGTYLNSSLIAYKEGFGGRGVAYKIYTLDI